MNNTTLIIRGSRLKMVSIALAGFLFAGLGFLMVTDGYAFGWLVMAFFGLTTLIGIFFLLKGPPTLLLTEQGFEMSTMFKPAVFAWRDVTGFYVYQVSGVKMIGMSFSPTYKKHQAVRNLTERFTGVASALPNCYTKSAEEICTILNEWLQRYGAQNCVLR